MQKVTLAERLARARQLLAEIHHVALATANSDSSPHLSPLFMAFDDQLNAYWLSSPESLHSQNIVRTGQVFLAVYDGREGHGGLYIKATAKVLEDKPGITRSLTILSKLKKQMGGKMGGLEDYTGSSPQRIYCAEPLTFWVNRSERNEQGIILRDQRHEISLKQLLGQEALPEE